MREDPVPGAGVEGEAGVHRVVVVPAVLAPAPAHTAAHQPPAATQQHRALIWYWDHLKFFFAEIPQGPLEPWPMRNEHFKYENLDSVTSNITKI